ncbi:MAG: hypothetical protein HRU25_09375 [Psychrobium sp.]|nr:hypothetical protein [Psychrobium sp.]
MFEQLAIGTAVICGSVIIHIVFITVLIAFFAKSEVCMSQLLKTTLALTLCGAMDWRVSLP